ncbi:hypothetical protein K402DRAFT_375308 [Aulographum hederae CBS 113979]|uniref:HCNGP-domain-containing protein n=1 Tax=Aulographum hederae CBS 113979 TaxID=1176131 RepID=A0A6G1H3N1_9PEZI|nr:hypothetical protein K402DRAFT_375308 [Aulographum hederae CBS 113979]
MLGLEYSSSEDEEVEQKTQPPPREDKTNGTSQPFTQAQEQNAKPRSDAPKSKPPSKPDAQNEEPPTSVAEGPAQGPTMPSTHAQESTSDNPSQPTSAPGSPYTTSRAAIRNLTMPPIPNLSIPSSPPGSPNPTTSAKVAKFLSLKQQGVHFNSKLASSTRLSNPGLFNQLCQFAGLSQEQTYASSLPEDLAVPTGWPKWAYVDELGKAQARISKERQEERARGQAEGLGQRFATATATASKEGVKSKGETPDSRGAGVAEKGRGGLDRDGGKGSAAPEKRKSRFDDRPRDDGGERKSRFDQRPVVAGRKRSRER